MLIPLEIVVFRLADTSCSQAPRRARAHKIEASLLPLEYQLDRFLHTVECRHPTWNDSTPGCTWKGVQCDDSGHMKHIDWDSWKRKAHGPPLKGFLNWDFLPRSTQSLRVGSNQLSSVPCCTNQCHSSGVITVDLRSLPQKIERFELGGNKFTGGLDLTALPSQLRVLYLETNSFNGEIDLTTLPPSLRELGLCRNKLSGSLDLTRLTEGIHHLWLQSNTFEGVADLRSLPKSMKLINVQHNAWKVIAPNQNFKYSYGAYRSTS